MKAAKVLLTVPPAVSVGVNGEGVGPEETSRKPEPPLVDAGVTGSCVSTDLTLRLSGKWDHARLDKTVIPLRLVDLHRLGAVIGYDPARALP